MPLANHISGPIGNGQLQSDSSNSTNGLNATTWMLTNENNMVTTTEYNHNHLWSYSTLYGSKYQSQNGHASDAMKHYGNSSLDNNSTNNSCHSSRLGSSVGKNSVKRIPARVWLTVSWILAMLTIGRFVLCLLLLFSASVIDVTLYT